LIVSAPLILLYEASIGISARVQRRMLRAANNLAAGIA